MKIATFNVNGVNGSFQPGEYTGPGPDNGTANAERQAVGLETSAPAFDFDGDPATAPTTANPDHLTENGIREELGGGCAESAAGRRDQHFCAF